MSIPTCREITIKNEETGTSRLIPFKKIKDIFTFNDAPYLAVGSSGNGKTTIAVDLIAQFGKEASKVYYVSGTEESVGDGSINKIPKCFKRPCNFYTLRSIWEETKFNDKYSNSSESTLKELLGKVFSKTEMEKITKLYESHLSTFKQQTPPPSSTDIDIFKTEILTQTILAGLNNKTISDLNLSNEDLQALNVLVSKRQKTILILDDVTSELDHLKSNPEKVFFNGSKIKIYQAFQSLLIDIFTKARHFNMVVVLFVHNWSVIDVKSCLKNYIVLDINACDQINSFRTISAKVRKEFQELGKKLYSNYKYHFIVSKNLGDEIYISKADLHENDEIEFDETNEEYIKLYNNVLSNNTNNIRSLESLI